MKNFVSVIVCLSLVGFTVARATSPSPKQAATAKTTKNATTKKTAHTAPQKKPSGKKADARTLMKDAKKSFAAMVKAARADQGLDPKVPKNKPFWKSTKALGQNLQSADKGLAAKSNDFFKGIANAREAEQQLKIDWQLTGSKNQGVIVNGKKLGYALARLRTSFSKEAARKKKGGELTADEKAAFGKIKAQQTDLLGKIAKLQKQAGKDKALQKGLRKIEAQAKHIVKEPATLDAYLATLYLLDQQIGLIRGYDYYVDKSFRTDYRALDAILTNYETAYVVWENATQYDWVSVDSAVDLYEGEDIEVTETITDEEIATEATYAESESFDLSESESEQVAVDEDTDAAVDADDVADDDSMDDDSDDDGGDMDDDGGDDGADDNDSDDDGGADDGGDDDGGDDGGDDDGE